MSTPCDWTTPDELRAKLERLWQRGQLLATAVSGGPENAAHPFPLRFPIGRPSARELAERFGEVMDWVARLQAHSREALGYGYALQYEQVNNRVQGSNALPVAAVIPSLDDALRLIRKQSEGKRAAILAERVLSRQAGLHDWIVRRPFVLLEHEAEWERLLSVLDWFQAHPAPGLYLRQLDIPGVDTKFIEAHRGLLAELLDEVLPATAINSSHTGVRNFARRYGLRSEPPAVEFRLLDPALYIQGLSDMAVPPEQFAQLRPAAQRVFITENRTNGLAFPDHPGGLVIFGLGYGIDRLAEIDWLGDLDVWYWGDIDTHGFGILNRLRAQLPHVRSLLMDRATLLAHRTLWGSEPADKRYQGDPTLLDPAELALFEDLRYDRLGERVRLEQERVGFGWLRRSLAGIT